MYPGCETLFYEAKVTTQKIIILKFIDVRISDLNIVLILLWLFLFTDSMK
jgi:hypothetical protein